MNGFASKFLNRLFQRKSARPEAARRRATIGFEPLEMRALLATVMPAPTTAADDVIVDGRIITGENYDSARAGSGGGGAGKVSLNDVHLTVGVPRASDHPGGVNVAFGDGSVRFVSNSMPAAGTHGSGGGGGAGKVSMQDFGFIAKMSKADEDPIADVIVGAGAGAPGGHVKVFSGAGGAELASFLAFPGFSGGVDVGAASGADTHGGSGGADGDGFDDILVGGVAGPFGHVKAFSGASGTELASFYAYGSGFNGGVRVATGDAVGDQGHGTHVAGTIGSSQGTGVGTGTPTGTVTFFDSSVGATSSTKPAAGANDTGIDYGHIDLYKNVWINQDLERVIEDLASDVAGQYASRRGG